MEKNKKIEEKEKNISEAVVDVFDSEEEKDLTIDDIENAPNDPEELFSEPPTLELDFDEEPTEDELKLEEMDVDAINEDFSFIRVVHPGNQVNQRRLARTGTTHNTVHAPRGNFQIQVL